MVEIYSEYRETKILTRWSKSSSLGANDLRVVVLLIRWRHYDTYQRLGVELEISE